MRSSYALGLLCGGTFLSNAIEFKVVSVILYFQANCIFFFRVGCKSFAKPEGERAWQLQEKALAACFPRLVFPPPDPRSSFSASTAVRRLRLRLPNLPMSPDPTFGPFFRDSSLLFLAVERCIYLSPRSANRVQRVPSLVPLQ
jgi:hypothetical protein